MLLALGTGRPAYRLRGGSPDVNAGDGWAIAANNLSSPDERARASLASVQRVTVS